MTTKTPATEGQAKIRELRDATQAVIERWDTPLWKDVPHTGTFIQRLREALAALDASPPIGRELTSAEIERIVGRIGPIGSHLLGPSDNHGEEIRRHMMRALVYVRDHGYLAQAPQSSPAAQGVMVDQILEVVNDWRANMHLIEVPPNTPYSTGVQNVLRSRLSALLTK